MSKQKIKVIISDLDGTLLNTDHTISDYTKSVFQELHKQNYLIIVATGRHHIDAMAVIDTLGIPVYLVTSNGARIHSPEKAPPRKPAWTLAFRASSKRPFSGSH